MMSTKDLVFICTAIMAVLAAAAIGIREGKQQAFESFVTGECWLSSDGARDIECTTYIGK